MFIGDNIFTITFLVLVLVIYNICTINVNIIMITLHDTVVVDSVVVVVVDTHFDIL